MAMCEVLSFTEPAEYAAAIPDAVVEISRSAPGPFAATLTRISFESLAMHRASVNQPHIRHLTPHKERAYLTFHTEPGPSVFESGMEVAFDSISRLLSGDSYFQRSIGPVSLGAMSLPLADMQYAGITATGQDLTQHRHLIITPVAAAMAKLQTLHRAAGLLAADAPELIAHPQVAHGMEQALIMAMVACLNTSGVRDDTSAQRRHGTIMRRFHNVLEADAGRPLYILEIAKAIGVSVRSLSVCCQEHLGMGPKKYLLLRRMNLARLALSKANANATTVTDVATQYGFWQFGRFAGDYKFLFGELPSATLRRQAA